MAEKLKRIIPSNQYVFVFELAVVVDKFVQTFGL